DREWPSDREWPGGSGFPAATLRLGRGPGRPGGSGRLGRLALHEVEHAVRLRDPDGVARPEIAAQDTLRERVLQLLLDLPLERARAVHGVVARLREMVAGGVVQHEPDVAVRQALAQVLDLDVHDPADVLRL